MFHIYERLDVTARLQPLLELDDSRDVLIATGEDHHWHRDVVGVFWIEKGWMTLCSYLKIGFGTRHKCRNLDQFG